MKKSKKKKKFKLFILLFLFSMSFFLSLRYLASSVSDEDFLRLLLASNSPYIESKGSSNFFSGMISLVSGINLSNPATILKGNYVYKDYANNSSDEEGSNKGNVIKDPYPDRNFKDPLVYIYNTHQLEEYAVSSAQPYNITPTVMMVSYILREKLNDRGIPSIVEERDVKAVLTKNKWSYAASYRVTRNFMQDAKQKNPTLQYFIDIHRDSVSKSISTAVINDKSFAKILFIVGLDHKEYKHNLAITTRLNEILETNYPGISRGIYKKSGTGVNGIYNQDISPNAILIEVGGEKNLIDEVFNTTEAIAKALSIYIGEKRWKIIF